MRPILHSYVWRRLLDGTVAEVCCNCTNLRTPYSIVCMPGLRRRLGRWWWGS